MGRKPQVPRLKTVHGAIMVMGNRSATYMEGIVYVLRFKQILPSMFDNEIIQKITCQNIHNTELLLFVGLV